MNTPELAVATAIHQAFYDFGSAVSGAEELDRDKFEKMVDVAARELILRLQREGFGNVGAELASVAAGLTRFGQRVLSKAENDVTTPEFKLGLRKAFEAASGYVVGERL